MPSTGTNKPISVACVLLLKAPRYFPTAAMHSISVLAAAPATSAATMTVERAGGSFGNAAEYAWFYPLKILEVHQKDGAPHHVRHRRSRLLQHLAHVFEGKLGLALNGAVGRSAADAELAGDGKRNRRCESPGRAWRSTCRSPVSPAPERHMASRWWQARAGEGHWERSDHRVPPRESCLVASIRICFRVSESDGSSLAPAGNLL